MYIARKKFIQINIKIVVKKLGLKINIEAVIKLTIDKDRLWYFSLS